MSAVRDDSDTVGLLDAARIFGVSKSMAYRSAAKGDALTEGVRILKFGTTTRPVYRVSKRAIEAALGGTTRSEPAASPPKVTIDDLGELRSMLVRMLGVVDEMERRASP